MDGGLDRLIDHKEFNNHLNFLTVIIIWCSGDSAKIQCTATGSDETTPLLEINMERLVKKLRKFHINFVKCLPYLKSIFMFLPLSCDKIWVGSRNLCTKDMNIFYAAPPSRFGITARFLFSMLHDLMGES
jgi:hypothetical protein